MPESNPANRWFDKARDDLVAAEKLHGIPETSSAIVAFHAQQAAEKYLKGFLIHHEVEPPRTHDLEEILGKGAEIEGDIVRLRSTVEGLTDYGVAPRYPDTGITVSSEDAAHALQAAREVRAWINQALSGPPA